MRRLRVLLSDGSGVTSRQVATALGRAGHEVEAVNPPGPTLMAETRWVNKLHPVPFPGDDPLGWCDAVAEIVRSGRFDVLLATQEQVAVLTVEASRFRSLGVGLAVPEFASLQRVQDKISAVSTLRAAGLPQPPSQVVRSASELLAVEPPVYVKAAVSTASRGVHFADSAAALEALAPKLSFEDGALVQQPVDGRLVMVQSVFDRGRLVAWHAAERVRSDRNGGGTHKLGLCLPEVRDHLVQLGDHLKWHGALSMDAVYTSDGPFYIDINPRIVEPINASLSGVDLVGALLRISLGEHPEVQEDPVPGTATHQLLLAVLSSAAEGRLAIARELWQAITHTGSYRGSVEELLPPRGDLRTVVPLVFVAGKLLYSPGKARKTVSGAVGNYALTAQGWRDLQARYRS
ncbi:ATP-grasp domain-containing protein [Allokutzneria sp. A3M-2-11 16]|uniref:ATP-grasp domain-containing protein n=1 Tax=Allokutzneria sp. A3M-2-11 16 TaxID=2962043 RepID=UPI0020B7F07E|nr:ATP-grasp domain-containing protein [Allokutzneria sp. A3M-2-11 16]MCP3805312.1 ATP-grasp domain-containing protein [Allokutzneria sp. A3M-2-11 16]